MLEKVSEVLILFALTINFSLFLSQSTATAQQSDCQKPNNVSPVELHQLNGIWYVMQTTDSGLIYKDLKCVRIQSDDQEDDFKSAISPQVCNGPGSHTSIGTASNLYLNSKSHKYENNLYINVQQEPGIFKAYTQNKLVLTIYILKLVQNDRMIFSACFKLGDVFVTQFYKYLTYKQPRLDKQKIADEYKELGIEISHNMYIEQCGSACINETYYGAI